MPSTTNDSRDIIDLLVELCHSMRCIASVPVLLKTKVGADSWQVALVTSTHEEFNRADRPDKYVLDCIYYLARDAKFYRRAEPEGDDLMAVLEEAMGSASAGSMLSLDEWLEHMNHAHVDEFDPTLVDLATSATGVVNEKDQARVETAMQLQMKFIAEYIFDWLLDLLNERNLVQLEQELERDAALEDQRSIRDE